MACAYATPPDWVKKSSGAEAWALYLIMRESVTPPRMLTDRMTRLQTASRSTRDAVAGRSSAARRLTASAARKQRTEAEEAATAQAVSAITARSSTPVGPSAAERMAALRARLQARTATE